MNLKLWLPAHDPHKIKSFSTLAGIGEGLTSPLLVEWQLLGEGESVFFKNVASFRLIMLQWKAPHS